VPVEMADFPVFTLNGKYEHEPVNVYLHSLFGNAAVDAVPKTQVTYYHLAKLTAYLNVEGAE
jgi:hypothetical protein